MSTSILAYIDRRIASAYAANSSRDGQHRKLRLLRESMAQFTGEDSYEPMSRMIDPDFICSYGEHIYAEISRGASRNSCDRLMESLATVVRSAIADGMLPPVNPFAEARKRLARKFAPQTDAEAAHSFLTRDTLPPKHHGFATLIDKLYAQLALDMPDRNRREQTQSMLIYLLGLNLKGIEIRELLEAPRDAKAIFNAALNTDIEINATAAEIIQLLNTGRKTEGEYLIKRPRRWEGLSPDQLAETVACNIRRYLHLRHINLFAAGSIFNDWLCLAAEKGMPGATVTSLAIGNSPAAVSEVIAAPNHAADHAGQLLKRWYVLRSYRPGMSNDRMRHSVMQTLDNEAIPYKASTDIYDPQDLTRKMRRGKVIEVNSRVVAGLLFVRVDRRAATLIDRAQSDASLLRMPGEQSRYATVPHRDILAMIEFLHDYHEGLEIVGIDWQRVRGADSLGIGVKVRIIGGPFDGLEGFITDIVAKTKGAAPEKREYKVTADGFAMTDRVTVHAPAPHLSPTTR